MQIKKSIKIILNKINKRRLIMKIKKFQDILKKIITNIEEEGNLKKYTPTSFEEKIANKLQEQLSYLKIKESNVEYNKGSTSFPDIAVGVFGIEVKTTESNSWVCLGNSIMEGTRKNNVKHIYIIFLKKGGEPGIKLLPYEKAINNIKVTHSPRYEIRMDSDTNFFDELEIDYESFRNRNDKVNVLKNHYRKNNISSWFLDADKGETTTSLSLVAFSSLEKQKKQSILVELICLFPQIVASNYDEASVYLLTKHGLYNPSLRDTFSAGGKYIYSGNNYKYPRIVKHLVEKKQLIQDFFKENESTIEAEWGKKDSYFNDWINQVEKNLIVDSQDLTSQKNFKMAWIFNKSLDLK